MSVDQCRVCQSWPATPTDGLCDICATDAGRIERAEQAWRTVRAIIRRYQAGLVSDEQFVRSVIAVENARPR